MVIKARGFLLFRMNILPNISYQFFNIKNCRRISTQAFLLNKHLYKLIQILLYFGNKHDFHSNKTFNKVEIHLKLLTENNTSYIITRIRNDI